MIWDTVSIYLIIISHLVILVFMVLEMVVLFWDRIWSVLEFLLYLEKELRLFFNA